MQLVSPYDADLQKRSADLIAEISSWELQMRSQAGYDSTDPRNPAVQAAFQKWLGELEAMESIQAATDPAVFDCRAFAAAMQRRVRDSLPSVVQAQLAGATVPATLSTQAGPGPQSPGAGGQSCESIPLVNATKDVGLLQQVMEFQCKVSGASDAYFESLAAGSPEAQAPRGASSTTGPSGGVPSAQSREMCLVVFSPPEIGGETDAHGPPVSAIIGDLNALIVIEAAKKPKAARS